MALPQSPDRSTRAVGLRHHWLVAAVDRRSTMGPNTVCHVEQSLAAVEHLQVEPSLGLMVVRAVDRFTMGHVLDELAELETHRRDPVAFPAAVLAAWAHVHGLTLLYIDGMTTVETNSRHRGTRCAGEQHAHVWSRPPAAHRAVPVGA